MSDLRERLQRIRAWWESLRAEVRWERKVEDLWVGAFWRVDGAGRAHVWIIIPPFGLPCFPLHFSWDTLKVREPKWMYLVDQHLTIIDRRVMPLNAINQTARERRIEVRGESFQVLGVTLPPPGRGGQSGGGGGLTGGAIRIYNPDKDEDKPPPEGWLDWEDFWDDPANQTGFYIEEANA